jgi:hypothetical protein
MHAPTKSSFSSSESPASRSGIQISESTWTAVDVLRFTLMEGAIRLGTLKPRRRREALDRSRPSVVSVKGGHRFSECDGVMV